MKILVNKNYVVFDTNEKVNKREFKATPLEFEFSEDYEGLTCKAVFSIVPKTNDEEITYYQQPIIDGKCYIPYEVMEGEGILIGAYGYALEGDEYVLRYSPEPKNLWLLEGSYYEGAEAPEEILPSQFEQYIAYLNGEIIKLNRIKIETEQITNGVRIDITNSDGVTTSTNIYNGKKGEKGDKGDTGATGEAGAPGRDGYVQYTAGSGISIVNNTISSTIVAPIYIISGNTEADINIINTCCNKFDNGEGFSLFVKYYDNIDNHYYYVPIVIDKYSNSIYQFYGISCYGLTNEGLPFITMYINTTGYWGEISNISLEMNSTKVAYSYLDVERGALTTNNTRPFTPTTGSYEPATAKYVDDNVNPTIITSSDITYTIASLTGNKTYKLGEITSLTITATTTFDRESVIYFTSGLTPTSVSIPDSLINIGDVPTMSASGGVNTGTCEASKSYIISVLNNIVVWKAY